MKNTLKSQKNSTVNILKTSKLLFLTVTVRQGVSSAKFSLLYIVITFPINTHTLTFSLLKLELLTCRYKIIPISSSASSLFTHYTRRHVAPSRYLISRQETNQTSGMCRGEPHDAGDCVCLCVSSVDVSLLSKTSPLSSADSPLICRPHIPVK